MIRPDFAKDICLKFALIGGALAVCPEEYKDVSCGEWLKQQHGISDEDFAKVVHGRVSKYHSVFIGVGPEDSAVDMNQMKEADLLRVVNAACDWLWCRAVDIWNGMALSEDGNTRVANEYVGKFACQV